MRRWGYAVVGLGLMLAACGGGTQRTAVLPPAPTAAPTTSVAPVALPSTPAPVVSSPAVSSPTAVPPNAVPTGSAAVLTPLPAVTAAALTADQAYALVRRAYDAANYAFATNDAAPFTAAVGGKCKCLALVAATRALVAKGERLRGGGYSGLSLSGFRADKFSDSVSVFYSGAGGAVIDAKGKRVDTIAAMDGSQDVVTLQRNAQGWYIVDISTITAGRRQP